MAPDGVVSGHRGGGGHLPAGRLEAILRRGDFAITAETTPPDAAAAGPVLERVAPLRDVVDAINVTDGAGARAHMSALACAAILARDGIEAVLQITARDRNRLAIQGDLIGAGALGIANILCLHGDDPGAGDQPDTKPVHDLDSREIMATARALRAGALPGGRPVEPPPRLFIGAADSPRETPADWEPAGVLAKIEAGADFFQTQYCFDMAVLRQYLARLGDHGVFDRAYFLIGIGPLVSARMARWMNDNLFGVSVPEAVIRRLDGAADQRAEGLDICVEWLDELRSIDGVAGVHMMAPRQEREIATVIERSGILAERQTVV